MAVRRACKVDVNHAEIRDALRARGFAVLDMAPLGNGAPDLLVGVPAERSFSSHRNVLLEVKRPKGGRLEPKQVTFKETWTGERVYVVRSITEALAAIGRTHADAHVLHPYEEKP